MDPKELDKLTFPLSSIHHGTVSLDNLYVFRKNDRLKFCG